MIMFDFLYHTARRACHQEAHCSAGNRANREKLTTGRTKPSSFLSHFFVLFFSSMVRCQMLLFTNSADFPGQSSTHSNMVN
jgi:hypothetical protein